MTETTSLSAPFHAVAGWLQRGLPAGLRGVSVMAPDAAPESLPRRARVRLVLPTDRILWREIEMPALPEDRRQAWIAARLEESSPWASGAFYWAEGGQTEGRLRLALTAAEPVRALAGELAAGGRRLVEVTAGPLWLMEDAGARAGLVRRLIWGWALVVVLGLGLGLWALLRISDAGVAEALATSRLQKLTAAATTTSAASQAARDLLAGKTEAASLATALDRLAGSLPLDSYLETLRLTPETFQISGRSAAPEAIIPALEGGGKFAAVDFAGASARDAVTGLYSFTLSGQTRGAP
jgi:hypothetical protein